MSFSFEAGKYELAETYLRLTKIGYIRFRGQMPIGRTKTIRIYRDVDEWMVAVAYEAQDSKSAQISRQVGIDRGANVIAATSEGLLYPAPDRNIAGIKKLQRKLARQKRGSKRRDRTKIRLQKRWRKERRRRDWEQHQISCEIANRVGSGLLVIEDLKIGKMTARAYNSGVAAKAGLNRQMLAAGLSNLERLFEYKVKDRGGTLVKVNPAYTSQTCSCCGHCCPENRKTQAAFSCVSCGYQDHADINAAKNILARATKSGPDRPQCMGLLPVEDARQGSGEAGTTVELSVLGNSS